MTRSERLSAAVRIVREAATTIRTFTRPHRVRLKASVADTRTSTDRQVERLLERSVVSTGLPSDRMRNADSNLAEFADLVLRVRDVRRIGVAGLDLGYVSAGMLDAYWERGDGPWDWAAGALVREPGGVASTWEDRFWRPGDETMPAGNGLVHDAVPARLAAVRGTAGPVRPADSVGAR